MFVYTPLVAENEYVSQESSSFLKKYYNGNISAMLSAFLDNDKLSASDIDDLRSLLDRSAR
jgi:BlaI family penicillinase repressor